MAEAKRPILELRDIEKSYGATDEAKVIDGVDLAVQAGESLAIIGPSGCGKSTLLNIMGTLDRPTAGSVRLDGEDVARLDDRALAGVRNKKIGFIFQLHHLLPQCSIIENVMVPTIVGPGGEEVRQRAERLLERVGLSHRLSHRPGQLSGGERQRVAVVRALVNRPSLLLADEPTGSLDRKGAEGLCDLLVELNKEEKVTIIMVTHSMALAERMGKVLELDEGKLGRPKKLEDDPKAEKAPKAEEAGKAEEAREVEEQRRAEEARKADEARKAEESRRAEAKREAEQERREEARLAEEPRQAEEAAEKRRKARKKKASSKEKVSAKKSSGKKKTSTRGSARGKGKRK